MKDTICTAIGIIGGVIASLFGGWDTALQTLVIFMAIDYITGLVVAGVFHASPKTKTGALESKAISIVENAGLMGLPIPAAITKAIDILKQRAETPEKGKN